MAEAWVTLATNDTYALGALVLGQSLRRVGTSRKLHILVTPGVTQGMREHLAQIFDCVSEVDVLDSKDEANLVLIQRPELGVTFTKLHCWLLTQYTKCVFLDADCLVIQNSDELFSYPELSAAPDIGWPDIFNSGVFVLVPSHDTFTALVQCGVTHGSFDGGDQGLLNTYFSNWNNLGPSHRLPFTFNMSANAIYTYKAAFKRFAADIKIVHFLGAVKPWHHTYDFNTKTLSTKSGDQTHLDFLQKWWSIFADEIMPNLHHDYTNLAGCLAQCSFSSVPAKSDEERQLDWERGTIDYKGHDSWANIQKHIDEQLK